jgi:hypothetical protein
VSWLSVRNVCLAAILVCSLCHAGILVHGAYIHFPNVDEIAHLPAGVSHWRFETFRLYPVNPPLTRLIASIPAVARRMDFDWSYYAERDSRPEFAIGIRKLRERKLLLADDYFWPRMFCIPLSFVGMAILARWMWRIYGPLTSALIAWLWCFSPNVLAHAQTITPDVAMVSTGVLSSYASWKYAICPRWHAAFWMGIAMGIAMLSKLTWIILPVIIPVTVIGLFVFGRRRVVRFRKVFGLHVMFSICVAVILLNAGYLFEGTCSNLGSFSFRSELLGGNKTEEMGRGNVFSATWLERLPVPFPENYVLGIDYLKWECERGDWSFLNGTWRHGSWWYYYILTTCYKTPESVLLASILGATITFVRVLKRQLAFDEIAMLFLLGWPAALAFVSVSYQGGFNHHHRYVLMIYPSLFVLATIPLSLLRRNVVCAYSLAVLIAVVTSFSSFQVAPHYLSYFNLASGGPSNGWKRLGYSNIDWGQDILLVADWIREHPEARPLAFELSYFGSGGELFGLMPYFPEKFVTSSSLPSGSASGAQWVIVNVKALYNLPGQKGLQYLQRIEPVDRIGYSHLVFLLAPPTIRDSMLGNE